MCFFFSTSSKKDHALPWENQNTNDNMMPLFRFTEYSLDTENSAYYSNILGLDMEFTGAVSIEDDGDVILGYNERVK